MSKWVNSIFVNLHFEGHTGRRKSRTSPHSSVISGSFLICSSDQLNSPFWCGGCVTKSIEGDKTTHPGKMPTDLTLYNTNEERYHVKSLERFLFFDCYTMVSLTFPKSRRQRLSEKKLALNPFCDKTLHIMFSPFLAKSQSIEFTQEKICYGMYYPIFSKECFSFIMFTDVKRYSL